MESNSVLLGNYVVDGIGSIHVRVRDLSTQLMVSGHIDSRKFLNLLELRLRNRR